MATKKGGQWEYKIYFVPEADEDDGPDYYIGDDELMEKLEELVDANEEILKVTAYKFPLTKIQLTQALLYHMLIVFETKGWYWSIEKQGDGLTIQRSKNLSAVRDRHRQEDRNPGIELMKKDRGRKSVHSLIKWLWKEDELNKPYHFLTRNCQDFATAVFNYVAKTERL